MFGAILIILCIARGADARDARDILKEFGIQGGLVVHVGCGNGELTAALCAGDSYVVHGLDTDPANVARAREHLRGLGLYGQVSVDSLDGVQLPYVDNLVNLVVASGGWQVPKEEVLRVLAPGGVALALDSRLSTLDSFRKPRPDTIDDWPHFLHGPDNNAVAEDRVVGPPRHMQWLAGPTWTRHHHTDKGTYPTIRAVVSSGGRLYYMVDETKTSNMTVPSQWFLAARDAFSGVLLWKKPLQATTFERRLEQVWRTLVADGDRVYVPLGTDQPLVALDGASGERVRTYHGTEDVQEFIKDENRLFVATAQNDVLALQADTGRRLWQWAPDEGDALVPVTLAASDGKVFLKTDRSVYCLSADTGKTLWRVDLAGSEKKIRLRWPRERLIVKDGVVLCSYGGKDRREPLAQQLGPGDVSSGRDAMQRTPLCPAALVRMLHGGKALRLLGVGCGAKNGRRKDEERRAKDEKGRTLAERASLWPNRFSSFVLITSSFRRLAHVST